MRLRVFLLLSTAIAAIAAAAPPQDVPDMLVSRQLLEQEHLSVGQEVELSRDAAGHETRRFRIAGVYEPVPDPMRFAQQRLEARVHLPEIADTTITSVNVALTDPSKAAEMAADVRRRLPGLTARAIPPEGGSHGGESHAIPPEGGSHDGDERASTFLVLDRFHLAIAIVTIIGSGAFLLALMVMLVDERRETMTTLRLMGFTRGRLLTQVLVEGGLIAAAGVAVGLAFALGAQPMFNRFFQWRYDTTLVFLQVTPAIALRAALIAVPVGVAASAAAGWTILRQRTLTRIGR
jgi:putative ABC transport system permease protein